MNSLSVAGAQRVMALESDYTLDPPPGYPGDPVKSGVLLLKTIIGVSQIDSRAHTTAIRAQLSNLPSYISDIGGDIIKFNRQVRLLVQELTARGETTNDLLVNLFDAFKTVRDDTFNKYILDKESKYEDGDLGDLSPERLMRLAEERYKILKDKGTWQAPTPEQEKIAALSAKLESLKKSQSNLKKGKTQGKNKQKGAKGKKKPGWLEKNERPSDSELKKPKQWNGKSYNYCHSDTGGK